MDNIAASICYRPTDHKKVIRPSSENWRKPCVHVSWASWDHCDTCWRNNTTGHKQSWSFLKCIGVNVLRQLIKETAREGRLCWTVCFPHKEGCWCGDTWYLWLQWLLDGGIQIKILRGGSKAKKSWSQIWALGEQTFTFSDTCLEESHGDTVMKRRGAQEYWLNHA